MGFRFRRALNLIPGVRLNVSKSGVSLSAGVPGAMVNLNKDGAMATVGVPGTGLSYRTRRVGLPEVQRDEPALPDMGVFPPNPGVGFAPEDMEQAAETVRDIAVAFAEWLKADRERLELFVPGIIAQARESGWGPVYEWWSTRFFEKLKIELSSEDPVQDAFLRRNMTLLERTSVWTILNEMRKQV